MNLLTSFRCGLRQGSRGVATLVFSTLSLLVPATTAMAEPVLVGANVTFAVTAEGTPTPTFQWRKNGVDIPGATGSILVINSVTLADAATYKVVATNEAGSAESPDEVLTVEMPPVNGAPTIVTHPVSQSATAGGMAIFSVVAAGTPAPTYQWLKNGVAIGGWTNAILELPAITTNDNGSYAAVVTNLGGSVTSNAAVLTVNPLTIAPVITTQPSNQNPAAGGSVTLSVAASGTPAPTFQWTKNNVPISGATSTSLVLSSVTSHDSANYIAIATNAAGSTSSNAAVVTVVEPVVVNPPPPPPPGPSAPPVTAPVVTKHPTANQTAIAGSSASLTVMASGNPAPKFQWRKNGTNVIGGTEATLSLTTVTPADAATYNVIITNSAGATISQNAVVAVHMAPIVTTQPASQAIAMAGSARFTVAVSAIPGATLQWYKNGAALPGATAASLALNAITANDAGSYHVVATNDLGTATSASASLVIAAPPIITAQPLTQVVAARSNVIFATAASGSPAPTFQWKKNGVNIPGATGATLSFHNVSSADSGSYSVDATNSVGWVSSNRATLTVTNTSGAGGSDNGDDVSSGSSSESRLVNLSVRATAGTGSNGLIVGFVINGSSTKPVLIRGIGPTLRQFGVSEALSDPKLSLYSGNTIAAANDDWMANENAALIAGTSARVGAFKLADETSDAVLMTTLQTGAYTAQLSGKAAAAGVALVEVYDAAAGNSARLVNLSVRTHVGSGADAPNVGFVITGTTPKRVVIRAVGPTLAAFGVTGAISDPQVELFQGSSRINHNDNWGGSAALSSTFSQVGAFGFEDAASRDAVLVVTLDPGAYTVVVSGVNGASGVGLVELYEAP